MGKILLLAASCVLLTGIQCQILESDVPVELIECAQLLGNQTGDSVLLLDSSADVFVHCLQQFLWKDETIQWSDFNITEKDKGFVNSLVKSSVYSRKENARYYTTKSCGIPSVNYVEQHAVPAPRTHVSEFVHQRRSKRHSSPGRGGARYGPGMGPGPGGMGPGNVWPLTGFRIRREYRRMSDRDRNAFHSAINIMKKNGQYDTFANLHRGIAIYSAHGGPNFLGWHRFYLAMVEEAIRRISPWISLPYWDSTLDFDMDNPVDSIIWTEAFLGNGNGFVTTGPFGNWTTPTGQLTRNIGGRSQLFTKEDVRRIWTRCRVRDITMPTAMAEFNFEQFHGGPHNWVGGQMSGLNTASHDPVFFLHHAFVDYIWEVFRIRQATFCGVNPATDYPPTEGLHAANRPMDGLSEYRNIDGYRNYWTQFWYRYERSPTCSMWKPSCRSPYLRCDLPRQRCVSMARMGPAPIGGAAGGAAFAAMAPSSMASESLARAQESTIDVGPRFVAPPSEPRTQAARMGMVARRKKRAVDQTLKKNYPVNVNSQTLGPISQPSGQQSDFKNGAFVGGVIGINSDFDASVMTNQDSYSSQLLPLPDYHETTINDMLKPPIKNSFIINGKADLSQWAFIPVKVTYTNKKGDPVAKFSHQENRNGQDFQYKSSSRKQTDVLSGTDCIQDESGAMQVRVQSMGLNYNGDFSDYALIDKHLPIDSATIFIGIKSPGKTPTKVILSAVHSCGLMCQAYCHVPGSVPSFRPCAGVLKVSDKDPNVYGRTYEEAVSHVQQTIDLGGGIQDKDVKIFFDCSNVDKFSWFANQRA